MNEHVEAEWVDETLPEDRVRSVLAQSYEAQSLTDIAEAARTSPDTAQKHLRSLVENDFAEEVSGRGESEPLYRRSPESYVIEQVSRIRADIAPDELAARIAEMQDEIHEYQERFSVDSPEEAASQDVDIDAETLREWQTTHRNLAFSKVAHELNAAVDIIEETTDDRPSRR